MDCSVLSSWARFDGYLFKLMSRRLGLSALVSVLRGELSK